jgi:hypothetical protein
MLIATKGHVMLAKLKNKKHGAKAMSLSKQYTANQLEAQIYRAGFLNALGKLFFWVPTTMFMVIGCLMAYEALFLGASAEKIRMFLRLGVFCALLDTFAYLVFRAWPERDLRILEEALRVRQERDRGLAHFAAIGEAKRQSRAEDGNP